MTTEVSQHCARLVRQYVQDDAQIAKSLAELGLVNAHVSVIHEKGTEKSQVNLCFHLKDGDNIEGVARKFGMGVVPSFVRHIQQSGLSEEPKAEFFCIPQTEGSARDIVVAIFSFEDNMRHTTQTQQAIPQPLN